MTMIARSLIALMMVAHMHAQGGVMHAAVTCAYPKWTGRFGDQLFHYVRARYVAHCWGLAYLCRPFKYSDQLVLHDAYPSYEHHKNSFAQYRALKHWEDVHALEDNTLYGIDFFFTSTKWGSWDEICTWDGALEDKAFIEEMKRMISPIKPLALVSVPQDKHAVAVHVRKGGGFDRPLYSQQIYRSILQPRKIHRGASKPPQGYEDVIWPLKLPPDQYYIDQIKRLYNMLGCKPMYVYIFTDDRNPERIAGLYGRHLKLPNVTFDYRRTNNHHANNVLEDFFSMSKFPYLIRSGSHFAQMAQIIGNHTIVIYPLHAVWDDNKLIIDQVGLYRRS
jgi:hypothetical protein